MADAALGTVLVTGSSTGIGRATALKLDQIGFTVFAGVRNPADGEPLQAGASDRLQPLIVDVTDEDTIFAAVERIDEASGGKLAGLVNNAGIGFGGPVEHVKVERFRQMLEVNLVGQFAMIQAFLPMLRRARGRIVNLSSIGGRVAIPLNGPYTASKFALEGLSDSLRRELRPQGVSVSLIEPGAVKTPIWDKALVDADEMEAGLPPEAHENYGVFLRAVRGEITKLAESGVPPEEVADRIADALTAPSPKTRYMIGREAKARWAIAKRVPDRTMDWLVARALRG